MQKGGPIMTDEYTYYDLEPKQLTFRQKLALEWIIFKAWIRRVIGK